MFLTSRALIPFGLTLHSGRSKGPTLFFCTWGTYANLGEKKIANDVTNKGLISKISKQFTPLLKKSKNGQKV